MANTNHRVLINGAGYKITGGRTKINGVNYNIINGRTKIGGVSYNINFQKPVNNVYTAQLYSDGSMSFQINDRTDTNKTLISSYTGFTTASYNGSNRPWYSQRGNIKNVSFDEVIKPANTAYWFHSCPNLTTFDGHGLDMTNVKTMYGMFDYCEKLNANTEIFCGPNVTNFAWAYENCKLLTGRPVCGPNVVNMRYTYSNCYKLAGPPVCGDKVVDFEGAYYYCNNMRGAPVIGPSVNIAGMAYYCCTNLNGEISVPPHLTYIRYLYGYCPNVTGAVRCSDNVTNFYGTYSGCSKVNGIFQCGKNVTDMSRAYEYCTNVQGHAVIGESVKTAYCAYRGCTQLTNAYFNNCYNATNLHSCFAGKSNSRRLNIYATGGTNTWNCLLQTGTNSIVGASITWTPQDNYYYNSAYNIYIYNEAFNDWTADTAYWPNKTHLLFTNYSVLMNSGTIPAANYKRLEPDTRYTNADSVPWRNIKDTLTTVDVLYPTIYPLDVSHWFSGCTKLSVWNNSIISDQLSYMDYTFNYCTNLTQHPGMLDTVTSCQGAFANCSNMQGSPICRANVTDFTIAYVGCYNLTGKPVCGERVIDMTAAYAYCNKLTGLPVFGSNVRTAYCAYQNCTNLSAVPGESTIYIGEQMQDMYATFRNCANLCANTSLIVRINSRNVSNMTDCFLNTNFSPYRPLIIYVPSGSTTNRYAHYANTYGYTGISSIAWSHPYPNMSVNVTYGIQIYHFS